VFRPPAVGAEVLHAICLLLEHPLARLCQLEGQRSKYLGVTQRRGGWKGLVGLRLDQA
jgi:hypothetical protein